jgi:hypothetical protein
MKDRRDMILGKSNAKEISAMLEKDLGAKEKSRLSKGVQ